MYEVEGVMKGRAVAALLAVAGSTTAYADRIVVESYVGNRPAEADRVLGPIRTALERHGFIVAPDVLASRFQPHVWRSGGVRSLGPTIYKKIEDGAREFEDAKLSAATTLKTAIDLARANPVAWANEPKYRDQVRRGLLLFALALDLRAKDARDQASHAKGKRAAEYSDRASSDELARDEAIDDLLRNFPAFVVKADEYGGEAEALYQEASKRAQQNGGGSIDLDVDDPNVIVYVDESQQPRKTTIGNIVAGRHRVLIVSAAESHEYSVDVLAHRRSRIVVKWGIDSVLKLGDWAGFAFASDSERQHEPELLASLVGTSGSIDIAATLTVRADGTSVSGKSYDMRSSKPIASCTAALSRRADADDAEQFARCLAGEKNDRHVATGAGSAGPRTPPIAEHTSTSVGSSTSRTPAVAEHSTGAPARPVADASVNDTKAPATEADAGDSPGDTVQARDSSRRWMLWSSIGAFGVAAISGGLTAKFVLDGRSAGDDLQRVCAVMCTSEQAKTLIAAQDTANHRAWIAGGVSGVAVVGGVALLLLWHRSEPSSSIPTAQLVPGGASVGWAGSF